MLLDVELGPARREIFDKDPVTIIAESVKKFLALRLCNEFGRNFDDDLAIAFVGIDPFDVIYEFFEVELEPGKRR